jgi:hypothetical protein
MAVAVCVAAVALAACSDGAIALGVEDDSTAAGRDGGAPDSGNDVGQGQHPDGPISDAKSPGDGASKDVEPPPSCPTKPPTSASVCPEIGLVCEFGTQAALACNRVATCTAKGWSYSADPGGTGGTYDCPEGGTCPSTYPSSEVGKSCTTDGLVCSYPQGTCTCAAISDGSSPPTGAPEWRCFPAEPGCPSTRPNEGTHCDASTSAVCNYGACAAGVDLRCEDGIWQQVAVACSKADAATGP